MAAAHKTGDKSAISWKRNLYAVGFSQLVATIGFSVIMPILPLYVRELGAGSEQEVALWSGLVFSSQAVTMAIFGPIWGAVSDRYGRKIMLERAMFGGAVLMVLMGFAQNVQQLTILRAIQGMVTGVVTASNALVATTAPRERAGYALGLVQTSLYVGNSGGPLIGGLICDYFGYRAAFWYTSVLLFVAGLLVLFLVQEPPLPARDNRGTPATKQRWSWQRIWQGASSYLAPVLGSAPLMFTLGMRALTRTGARLTGPVLALFVESIASPDARIASLTGLVSGINAAAGAVGALWLGRIADRIGARQVLIMSLIALTISYAPQAFAPSPVWLLPFQAIAGMAMGGILASLSAALARLSPEGQEGIVYGISTTAVAISNSIGPIVGSAIAAWLWLGAPFIASSIMFALSATIAALLLPRERKLATTAA